MAARKKGGIPQHIPTVVTRKMVHDLTGYGFTQDQVCEWLGIKPATLLKYYKPQLALATEAKNHLVINNAFQKAISADPKNNGMTMFWLKTRCGWREKDQIDAAATVRTVMESLQPLTHDEWDKHHPKPAARSNGATKRH